MIRDWAVSILIGAVLGGLGAWHFRGVEADRDLLELRKTFDTAVIAAQASAREDEQRMQREANKLGEEARKDAKTIDDKAVAVGDLTGRLQHAATVYASTAACDPGVARRGAAATSAAMVLSDMLGQCVAETTKLAKSADTSRLAGSTCERFADSLPGQNSPGSTSQ